MWLLWAGFPGAELLQQHAEPARGLPRGPLRVRRAAAEGAEASGSDARLLRASLSASKAAFFSLFERILAHVYIVFVDSKVCLTDPSSNSVLGIDAQVLAGSLAEGPNIGQARGLGAPVDMIKMMVSHQIEMIRDDLYDDSVDSMSPYPDMMES